ncbi:MAG: VOC family protein [Gammaproteobacteria bacterium]
MANTPPVFRWVDLGTSQVDAAQAFYSALFEWELHATRVGQFRYIQCAVDGKDVAAMYEMVPGQAALGYPVAWMPYLFVDQVDACTAKVAALGGKVLRGPFDVDEEGRTSAIQDPTGATFYLWQPRRHQGAQLLGKPGALAWMELATSDPTSAEAFYSGLLGWDARTHRMHGIGYTIFSEADRRIGGMVEEHDQAPLWRVYFAVSDCANAVRRAESLGASTRVPATSIPGLGRFAALRDPQGVGFAVVDSLELS